MESCFLRFPNFKRKALSLSYDDGTPSDIKLIEIMNKYGLKGTFNFTPNFINNWKKNMPDMDAIAFYQNCGHEISSHGEKHYSLADVNVAHAVKDLLCGREKLEQVFGKMICGMAYANGTFTDDVVDIAKKCGVHYARTTISTEGFNLPDNWLKMHATCSSKNPKMMQLAEEFIEAKDSPWCWANKPLFFLLWGHSYEFDNDNNWEVIEEFAKYVGGREDIYYATNGEICDYVRAFNSLEYSINGDIIYNPTDKDVYLSYFNKNILVPAGKTIYHAKDI